MFPESNSVQSEVGYRVIYFFKLNYFQRQMICRVKYQSVTNIFLRPNMNTDYYSVFRNHQIPNTEYYLGLRISEYQIWISIFGPSIRIPNTKQFFFKPIYLSCTRHFVLTFYEIIWTGNRANYLNIQILFGFTKNLIQNTNSTIRSNFLIVFEYRIICHIK